MELTWENERWDGEALADTFFGGVPTLQRRRCSVCGTLNNSYRYSFKAGEKGATFDGRICGVCGLLSQEDQDFPTMPHARSLWDDDDRDACPTCGR